MSYYVTNENSFLDIKNAHLRVTGNVHTDVLKVGSIGFQPAGSNISGTVNFTNVTTGVTTTSNLDVGGTLNLGTIELSASTHTLDHITARGNVTSTTVQFDNAHTSLVTSGNVEVGGELTVNGTVDLLSVSNVASIKKDSNVVTEFPRSKKLIKYPRVALTSASYNAYESGYKVTRSNASNPSYQEWEAFDGMPGDGVGWYSGGSAGTEYNGTNPVGKYNGNTRLATETELGEWLGLELPEFIKLQYLRLVSQSYSPVTNTIDDFILYAKKQSGDTWTSLGLFTGKAPAQNSASGVIVNIDANDYYKFFVIVARKSAISSLGVSIRELEYYGVPEYDPEAHGTDVVVKSVPNVPNTDLLDIYYDGQDYTSMQSTVDNKTGVSTYDATPINGVGFDATQKAFTFDANSSQYLSSSTPISGNYVHTISMWFKGTNLTSTGGDTLMWVGDNTNNKRIEIYIENDRINYNFKTNDCQAHTTFQNDRWYHLTCTYNGQQGSAGREIYVDGQRLSTFHTGNLADLNITNNTLNVGGFSGTSTTYMFSGFIANFRLFNRAITSDEVWQLYAYQKEYFGHGDLSMTLKAGRLGIGTSEPRAMLDVRGGLDVTGDVNIPSGRFTIHRFMGSGSGTFGGSGNITLPFNLDYGPDVNPNIGWEIRLAFGASGTNYGNCSISGCYDSTSQLIGVSEAFSLQLRTTETNWTNHGSECFLSRRETVAPAYQAIIRIVNPLAENIPPPSSGTSIRWHFSYECTGCYASTGATTIRGGGYFVMGAADRRMKYLLLNSATGSISGHYNFVAIS